MPNTSVQAAAEGLPEINRRRLLLGLAAASTAAAGIGAVEIAKASPAENPALIKLGNQTPVFEKAYIEACAHEDRVVETWAHKWPTAPATLTASRSTSSEVERDFFGVSHGRYIFTSRDFKWRLKRATSALKSRAKGRALHSYSTREEWQAEFNEASRLLAVAEKYEAKIERIEQASGYTDAWKARHVAVEALAKHITAVMKEPDMTMAGLLIKAEAMAAWGRVRGMDGRVAAFIENGNWPAHIAEAILRHAKGGAA
ncbi:MAG: hypothetical protein E5X48_11130 [Mesorhizobium sp.]|uniref:hypothetical protein n=1 Tax=Mesorhizobium sp. TaxID=1871066 RepID=UPI0011FA6143|nr:hypothetical protein [Mesorhizobium sp.]TIQ35970.1 MAG: hypothetical protein E5X48_11130 [Mesorhizobium sp.]